MRLPLQGIRPPLVIAHRGASAAAPENSVPAVELALRHGARWVEVDVQPSLDGVPVILHDDDLDRTTDLTGAVRSRRWADLRAADAGSWFSPEFTGTGVPSLTQVLDLLPTDAHLLLEIKGTHTADELGVLIAAVESHPANARIALQSFEEDALTTVRLQRPHRDLGLLREALDADPVAAAARFGASAYNPEAGAVLARPEVVEQLHRAGIAVAVWTSDTEQEWAALTALGVDAVITNRPGAMLDWQRSALRGPNG